MNPHHRILLVDDEPLVLSSLRRQIERIAPNATVVYALNAQSAVWQLEHTSISMVFTDMRMEGRDDAGWTVVAAAERAGVPVCVLTGADVDPASSPRCRNVVVRRKDRMMREHLVELLQPLSLASTA